MQGTWVHGAEENPPRTRRSATYIGMNTAIPADMNQNNPMTYLHAVHILRQVEIIQMNPLSSFFRASQFFARQWRQFIHRQFLKKYTKFLTCFKKLIKMNSTSKDSSEEKYRNMEEK